MINYTTFSDPGTMIDIMRREDSMVLTQKYIKSRFGSEDMTQGFQYMNALLNSAHNLYAVFKEKENGGIEVLALALREADYVTFFVSGAHPSITYKFMLYIIEQMNYKLYVFTTVGTMERLLTKIGFKLINFENGGRWYSLLPENKPFVVNKKADDTVH